MANPKLYGEFRSDHGNFYLIEIWDEDYTGNDPDRFNVTSNGFELNYSGQTDNILSQSLGCRCCPFAPNSLAQSRHE